MTTTWDFTKIALVWAKLSRDQRLAIEKSLGIATPSLCDQQFIDPRIMKLELFLELNCVPEEAALSQSNDEIYQILKEIEEKRKVWPWPEQSTSAS